jgi:hypothetical protein
MGQLDKNVLESSPALREFTDGPVTFNCEAKNLFANIRAGFDSQRESLPILFTIRDHVSDAGDFL